MIGIFWVYQEAIIGKACDINEGEEGTPGIYDCPYNHSDFWENEKEHLVRFPELRFIEYMDIPRGRVLFSKNDDRTVVYMDKVLFRASTKRLIREFFSLDEESTEWRTDPHYTTSQGEINRLLE